MFEKPNRSSCTFPFTGHVQVFFPHCPFPTSDIMRCLSNRDALLEGFVLNDIVGVHAFAPARAFTEVRLQVAMCFCWHPPVLPIIQRLRSLLAVCVLVS